MCMRRNIPLYLGLLILPCNQDEWLSCGKQDLLLKERCDLAVEAHYKGLIVHVVPSDTITWMN